MSTNLVYDGIILATGIGTSGSSVTLNNAVVGATGTATNGGLRYSGGYLQVYSGGQWNNIDTTVNYFSLLLNVIEAAATYPIGSTAGIKSSSYTSHATGEVMAFDSGISTGIGYTKYYASLADGAYLAETLGKATTDCLQTGYSYHTGVGNSYGYTSYVESSVEYPAIRYTKVGISVMAGMAVDTVGPRLASRVSVSGGINTNAIYELTGSAGVTIGSALKVDTIYESTSSAGITFENVLNLAVIDKRTDVDDVSFISRINQTTVYSSSHNTVAKIRCTSFPTNNTAGMYLSYGPSDTDMYWTSFTTFDEIVGLDNVRTNTVYLNSDCTCPSPSGALSQLNLLHFEHVTNGTTGTGGTVVKLTMDSVTNYGEFVMTSDGKAYQPTSTVWNTSSDINLKNSIVDIDQTKAVSFITSLKPRQFKYNADYLPLDYSMLGFIAQEVQATQSSIFSDINPTVTDFKVHDNPKYPGTYKTLNTTIFTPIMISNLQALNTKTDKLLDIIDTMQKKISTLENIILKLKK